MRENILNNKEINGDTKQKTVVFLIQAKNILLNNNTLKHNQNPDFKEKIVDFYNSSYELKSSKLEDSQEHMIQVRPEKPYLSSL